MSATVSRMGIDYHVPAADKLHVAFLLQYVWVYDIDMNRVKEHQRIMFFNFITFTNH